MAKVDFFGSGVTIAFLRDARNTLSFKDLFTIFVRTGISEWRVSVTIVVGIRSSPQDFKCFLK